MKTRRSQRFRSVIVLCLAVMLSPGLAHAATDGGAQAASQNGVEPMSSIVVDLATGKVLSADRATERRYPASTTKLMTAYLALSALRSSALSLDSPVIVTRRAASEPPSKMGFEPGSVIRLDIALRMMLVKSANDIAYAIGQTIGNGSMATFVDMMNATTARLEMKDSHFINPNGLPGEGQYSSAKDLAILASAIRTEFPAFSDYFGTEAISDGRRTMKNGNKLLGQFDGADGMKTGYICASGFNLVSSATRNGRTLIAVVMGANGTIPRERLSADILEKGFEIDPASANGTLTQLAPSAGEPVDISGYICGAKGRTARANERVEERDRDQKYGSPYLHDLDRAPSIFKVSLGGAAGNAIAPAGVSVIEAYGIPIPTPRPEPPVVQPEIAQSEMATPEIAEQQATQLENAEPEIAAEPLETAESGDAGPDTLADIPVSALRSGTPDSGLEKQNQEIRDILAQWADDASNPAADTVAAGAGN